jgi:hypothetical protein
MYQVVPEREYFSDHELDTVWHEEVAEQARK